MSCRPLFMFHSTSHLWFISFHYISLQPWSIPPYFMIHFILHSIHVSKFLQVHSTANQTFCSQPNILQPARHSAARYLEGNYPVITCSAANWSYTILTAKKIKGIMRTEESTIFKGGQSISKPQKIKGKTKVKLSNYSDDRIWKLYYS